MVSIFSIPSIALTASISSSVLIFADFVRSPDFGDYVNSVERLDFVDFLGPLDVIDGVDVMNFRVSLEFLECLDLFDILANPAHLLLASH